jgi:hypothetical protein
MLIRIWEEKLSKHSFWLGKVWKENELSNQTNETNQKEGEFVRKISKSKIESLLDFDLQPPIGGQANQNQ